MNFSCGKTKTKRIIKRMVCGLVGGEEGRNWGGGGGGSRRDFTSHSIEKRIILQVSS
jgi:hypothetical protein